MNLRPPLVHMKIPELRTLVSRAWDPGARLFFYAAFFFFSPATFPDSSVTTGGTKDVCELHRFAYARCFYRGLVRAIEV